MEERACFIDQLARFPQSAHSFRGQGLSIDFLDQLFNFPVGDLHFPEKFTGFFPDPGYVGFLQHPDDDVE